MKIRVNQWLILLLLKFCGKKSEQWFLKLAYDIFFEMYQNILSSEIVISFPSRFKRYCGGMKNRIDCDSILFSTNYLFKCAKINPTNKIKRNFYEKTQRAYSNSL